jgi:gliding motility-associated protein GldC
MRSSEIRFNVELDDESVPEKIFWKATEGPSQGMEEARAVTLSIWDHEKQETLRIDLWGKEMTVEEMKRFYIDTIGGLAQSLRSATSDKYMPDEMEKLCKRLVEYMQDGEQAPKK